tara:strand:+ start:5918 stop:6103 length:186 start_codon:yes stop_codon:yes gene_type:complete
MKLKTSLHPSHSSKLPNLALALALALAMAMANEHRATLEAGINSFMARHQATFIGGTLDEL